MRLRIVILFVLLSLIVTPQTTYAFNPFSVVKIITTINNIGKSVKPPSAPSATVPFGGKITESGTACKLHYWATVIIFGFPVTTPGVPIPLFGTKVSVGPPGLPISEVFTFPGITQNYPNHNEGKVGTWTLGIASKAGFASPLIEKVNSALSTIPPISIGVATFFNFSISCPDGGIILKIGTS